jgi:hypothetical protein
MAKLVDLILGPLPHEAINRALGLDLVPGEVVLTKATQKHVISGHPADYPVLLPHVAAVVLTPMYAGDDHRNGDGFELIGRIAVLNQPLLVAILLKCDDAGRYRVKSFYPVTDAKIQGRKDKGFLKIIIT